MTLAITQAAYSLDQQLALAERLVKARGLIPPHIKTPEECLAVILTGQELGIPPMQALRSVTVVQGKVVMAADLILALIARAGMRYEWVETTADKATLKLQRDGFAPYTHSFTMDDAKRANLTGNQVWSKYPADMLRKRCITAAARAYAPDIAMGLYEPSEAAEFAPVPTSVVTESLPKAIEAEIEESRVPTHEEANDLVEAAIKDLEEAKSIDELRMSLKTAISHHQSTWRHYPSHRDRLREYAKSVCEAKGWEIKSSPEGRPRKNASYPLVDAQPEVPQGDTVPIDENADFVSIGHMMSDANNMASLGIAHTLAARSKTLNAAQREGLNQLYMSRKATLMENKNAT